MSYNKTILLGNLGQQPELKYTPGGVAVCNFSIATKEVWVDKEGKKNDKTEWHNIVVWGKPAENCKHYLNKGSQVLIEGKLQTRSWEADDKTKRYKTEIVASSVRFMSASKENTENSDVQSKPVTNRPASTPTYSVDDIPF